MVTAPRGPRLGGRQRVPLPQHDQSEPMLEPVVLHVYDIEQLRDLGPNEVKALNQILRPFGTGAFHCGVEIFGEEYSFTSGAGVSICRPTCCEAHSFNDS